MTPAPHPLRCETCKNRPCPAYYVVLKEPYSREFGYNFWIDKSALVTSIVGCASHSASSDVLDDYNDELLTKLVQELAGTWRLRDGKLFEIIRSYRRKPIGAMKDRQQTKEREQG
jgi:hypothetical protein